MNDLVNSYKEIMGSYPSGVTVLTTYDKLANKPIGLTANSFTSVSINPLLVLFCIDESASSLGVFENTDTFGINILSEEQKELCFHFAKKGEEKFAGQDWSLSELSIPILANSSAVLECEKEDAFILGDHTVFVGRVYRVQNNRKKPIIYFDREIHVV